MNVTVCELRNQADHIEADFHALAAHVRETRSDWVLLPEMPFHPWLPGKREGDPSDWRAAVASHERWLNRLSLLSPAVVTGTRPVITGGRRRNEGFVWDAAAGCRGIHQKVYLPDEEGFWEASWYTAGTNDFTVATANHTVFGFQICTEIWFFEHAREYGRQGAHLILCPRATPASSVDKWVAGGRAAAVVSGAFCLSSNLAGDNGPGPAFGGTGWVIEPEEGTVLGLTSPDHPFLTIDIDPGVAEKAKNSYPRYVRY